MAQQVERDITHAERVDVFRTAISQIRMAGLEMKSVELYGASDLVDGCVYGLERQLRMFTETDEGQRKSLLLDSRTKLLSGPRRGGGRRGVDIIPGSVKQARQEAGLTLAEVAGREITRVAIHLVETGKTRPSMATLRLIAERTQKPLEFFTGAAS